MGLYLFSLEKENKSGDTTSPYIWLFWSESLVDPDPPKVPLVAI